MLTIYLLKNRLFAVNVYQRCQLFVHCTQINYLRRRFASERIVSLGVRHTVMLCVCVCLPH